MLKISVFKEFTFDAAHSLNGHNGLCANVHGHTYKLQVGISDLIIDSPGKSNNGMIYDFKDLKEIVKKHIIEKLDHQYLNDLFDFRTTVENIAIWMSKELTNNGLPIILIRLWETPTSFCEVTIDGN